MLFFLDLIAVSSTVIPLAEYQISNANETHHNHHPSPYSDEYKLAYMKHFRKKVYADDSEPDALITSEYFTDFKLNSLWFKTDSNSLPISVNGKRITKTKKDEE